MAFPRTTAVLLVLAASALSIAGCSTPSTVGPVAFSPDHDEYCVPIPQYNPASYGVGLPAHLTAAVTITSVQLVGAKNLTLGETSIMPVTSSLALGAEEYPPTGDLATNWARHVPGIGATVSPGQLRELVLEIRDKSGETGKMSGIRLTYESGGKQFVATSHLALQLKRGARC